MKRFIRELKETYVDVEGISLEGDEEEEEEEEETDKEGEELGKKVAKILSKRNTLSELESEASLSGEEVEALSVLPAGASRKRGLKRCQSTSKRHLPAF